MDKAKNTNRINAEELKKQHLDFLSNNYDFKQMSKKTVMVTTPYIDNVGDEIQVFVIKQEDGHYIIDDDGYVYDEIEKHEYLSTAQVKYLRRIYRYYNVKEKSEMLFISVNHDYELPKAIEDLAKCSEKALECI